MKFLFITFCFILLFLILNYNKYSATVVDITNYSNYYVIEFLVTKEDATTFYINCLATDILIRNFNEKLNITFLIRKISLDDPQVVCKHIMKGVID